MRTILLAAVAVVTTGISLYLLLDVYEWYAYRKFYRRP